MGDRSVLRRLLFTAGLLVAMGCGSVSQSPQCQKYIACCDALSATVSTLCNPSSLTSTYGPNGTCWASSALAQECTGSCTTAITTLQGLPGASALSACQ